MRPAHFQIPNRFAPMTADTIRDDIDDAIRELTAEGDDWDLMDVLLVVVDRIDHQVSRGYAVPPSPETASRCLTPRFVHERLGAIVREVTNGLKRIETNRYGETVLVYERRACM